MVRSIQGLARPDKSVCINECQYRQVCRRLCFCKLVSRLCVFNETIEVMLDYAR